MSTIAVYGDAMSENLHETPQELVEFGDWLRDAIASTGFSNKEVYSELGVSEGALYSWLRGTRRAEPHHVDRIAQMFGADANELRALLGHAPRRQPLPETFYSAATSRGAARAVRPLLVPVIGVTPTGLLSDPEVGEFVPLPYTRFAVLRNPRLVVVSGNGYEDEDIYENDYLVIDDAEPEQIASGKLVVYSIEGRFDTRRWLRLGEQAYLQDVRKPDDTLPLPAEEIEIVGVVRHVIHVEDR